MPMVTRLCQSSEMPQVAPTQKFEWPLNEVVFEVTWTIKYIIFPLAEDS